MVKALQHAISRRNEYFCNQGNPPTQRGTIIPGGSYDQSHQRTNNFDKRLEPKCFKDNLVKLSLW